MEPKKNLCAQIPISLHTRIRQEQEESGKSLSEFMTDLLTNYYENGGNRKMDGKQRWPFKCPRNCSSNSRSI